MTESVPAPQPEPANAEFLADVLAGLRQSPRSVPCKWLYDRHGSELFEQITRLPEYYLTRAETELLRLHAEAIAERCGPQVDLVEPGSGSSSKTRLLLDALTDPARYVPIDISPELLQATARRIDRAYPELVVEPVVGDHAGIDTPPPLVDGRRVVFFPGSSIGNFAADAAVGFLSRAAALAGEGGAVLVGVDLPKERSLLERAYDDAAGVTARFNRNLLQRMVRELHAEIDIAAFAHAAPWQPEASRIEMRLVAERGTHIRVGGSDFRFRRGDFVVTEHCHKYDVDAFAALAVQAGLTPGPVWFDAARLVSMHWLDVT